VMEKMLIWLTAASSCSWLAFSGVYIYILVTDKYQLIKKEGFYLGQPLSPLETSFFAYVYAVCLVAIGTMLAVAFFREICA